MSFNPSSLQSLGSGLWRAPQPVTLFGSTATLTFSCITHPRPSARQIRIAEEFLAQQNRYRQAVLDYLLEYYQEMYESIPIPEVFPQLAGFVAPEQMQSVFTEPALVVPEHDDADEDEIEIRYVCPWMESPYSVRISLPGGEIN
jgi:hypothetical protein